MRSDLARKGLWGAALVVEHGHGILTHYMSLFQVLNSSGSQGSSGVYEYSNKVNTFVTN